MDLIFDVGANIGDMTNIFKNNAKKVVAFEPNPQLSNQLRYRFNMDNVVIDPRGISDDIGIKNFNISAAHTISTLSDDWVTNSRFSDLNAWDLVLEIETITPSIFALLNNTLSNTSFIDDSLSFIISKNLSISSNKIPGTPVILAMSEIVAFFVSLNAASVGLRPTF